MAPQNKLKCLEETNFKAKTSSNKTNKIQGI